MTQLTINLKQIFIYTNQAAYQRGIHCFEAKPRQGILPNVSNLSDERAIDDAVDAAFYSLLTNDTFSIRQIPNGMVTATAQCQLYNQDGSKFDDVQSLTIQVPANKMNWQVLS